MLVKRILLVLICIAFHFVSYETQAQCDNMEPGFKFLSSSRGCAPFDVQMQTLFLFSDANTKYHVTWGDGSPQQTFNQADAIGVTIDHLYPISPVDCAYDVTIEAENLCNPLGSVEPVHTQVVVWTNDVIAINQPIYRVCQGYAADVLFTDNSDWNCFPRLTRENNAPRWIQWIYGTGPSTIPGVQVNGITPGLLPYNDPAPGKNPIYPVTAPGQTSLPIHVPVTGVPDIGKEFDVTLKNWNQCNPYDIDLTDGNPFNPQNGDLDNGDRPYQVAVAKIVIVDAPVAGFITKYKNINGLLQSTFCIGDSVYFQNMTANIAGSDFLYTWEFYDNPAGTGVPIIGHIKHQTRRFLTSGKKLIRLTVLDRAAAGSCESVVEFTITISPSLAAKIGVTDILGNTITPDFCQEVTPPLTNFKPRFNDVSVGTISADTRWRWDFYDENNALIRQEPGGGLFSSSQLGPFDQVYTAVGIYKVVLIINDNKTSCESSNEVQVHVYEKPKPLFSFTNVCEGSATTFTDLSTLNSIGGQLIISREWDMNYDGITFNKTPALDNKPTFDYLFPTAGNFHVALRVTTDLGGCSAIYDQTVIVDAKPVATFTNDSPTGCSILHVTFTNTSIATQPPTVVVKQFIWEVDDGAGYKTDLIQTPSDPGFTDKYIRKFSNTTLANKTYNVRLRVVTKNGCDQVSNPVTVTVYPGPASGFVSANYSPFNDNCTPISVAFTVDAETQSLNPQLYTWIISDSNGAIISQNDTGTDPKFSTIFTNTTQSSVNYSITLRALLAGGCSGDSTRLIRINPVPSSDFEITELPSDCDHKNYHFEALQKSLITYTWKIEVNGTTVMSSTTLGDNFDYLFDRIVGGDQNVVVSLITTNSSNCESSVTTQPLLIPVLNNINASFTATPASQTLPNSTVSILNTTNPGAWTYAWDFGDGSTSTDQNPADHIYATFGQYAITLDVSDGICTETVTNSIEIKPIPPIIDFEFDPPSGCSPLIVHFKNKSLYADPSTYVWSFGINQGTSNETNPTHKYSDPGVYTVTLSAANALGEPSQLTKTDAITVYAKPDASFALKPLVIYIPGGKLFTKNESFGADMYLWNFGDASTSTDYEPEHVYTEPGTFDVTMIASTALGCADTARSKTGVRVFKGGELLIPNAFSPNTGGPGSNGTNDRFLPLMRGVTNFQMMVFNRWGQMLFQTTNASEGWDGYFNGKLCQQDVYVYKITAKYEDGQTITKVGDINLIR